MSSAAGRLGCEDIREVGDGLRAAVLEDFKILGPEIRNRVAFGVGDDRIHLHQVDRDANHALRAELVT